MTLKSRPLIVKPLEAPGPFRLARSSFSYCTYDKFVAHLKEDHPDIVVDQDDEALVRSHLAVHGINVPSEPGAERFEFVGKSLSAIGPAHQLLKASLQQLQQWEIARASFLRRQAALTIAAELTDADILAAVRPNYSHPAEHWAAVDDVRANLAKAHQGLDGIDNSKLTHWLTALVDEGKLIRAKGKGWASSNQWAYITVEQANAAEEKARLAQEAVHRRREVADAARAQVTVRGREILIGTVVVATVTPQLEEALGCKAADDAWKVIVTLIANTLVAVELEKAGA